MCLMFIWTFFCILDTNDTIEDDLNDDDHERYINSQALIGVAQYPAEKRALCAYQCDCVPHFARRKRDT